MTAPSDESLMATLQRLTVLQPDVRRSERVRARCRAALAEQRPAGKRVPRRVTSFVLGPVVAGSMCAGYLLGMVIEVLRIYARR